MSKIDKSPQYYHYYPRLFCNYFSDVRSDYVVELSKAGYNYYQSILIADSIIDDNDISRLPNMLALQEETIKILTSIYGKDSELWHYWNKRKCEYFKAAKTEKNLWGLNNVDFKNYADLADEKSAFGKIAIDCMYVLSEINDDKTYEKLLLSHYYFSVGFQLYDDVKDFKDDFIKNQFNQAIYRLSKIINFADYQNNVNILNKLLYIRGVGQDILLLSINYFKKSITILSELNIHSEWLSVNIEMMDSIDRYLNEINGYIEMVKFKNEYEYFKPNKSQFFNYENSIKNSTFYNGIHFIANDYKKNYAELCHYIYISKHDGFEQGNRVHYSDIFPRSILNDSLIDIVKTFRIDADDFFNNECLYLIDKCNKDSIGGWSYFPTLSEIAADIDDLGQIIQFFLKLNRKDLVEKHCLKPIQIILENRVCDNGGIETWIIPLDNQTDLQKKQEIFNDLKWGKGPDLEVTANFIYALCKYDINKYKLYIDNALKFITKKQDEKGYWESRWYYGQYYGTYVCLRLLNCFRDKYSPNISLALKYIRTSQNEDGGFGLNKGEDSNAISTALALLTLKLFVTKNDVNLTNAEDYLRQTQQESGFWLEVDFIKPRKGDPYKSKTVTTAFVLKSLC